MAELMDSFAMKAGTNAICRISDQPITSGNNIIAISGCTLQRGVAYRGFVYIESGSLPGTLSQSFIVTVVPSNDFSVTPAISSGPTQSGLVIFTTEKLGPGQNFESKSHTIVNKIINGAKVEV